MTMVCAIFIVNSDYNLELTRDKVMFEHNLLNCKTSKPISTYWIIYCFFLDFLLIQVHLDTNSYIVFVHLQSVHIPIHYQLA